MKRPPLHWLAIAAVAVVCLDTRFELTAPRRALREPQSPTLDAEPPKLSAEGEDSGMMPGAAEETLRRLVKEKLEHMVEQTLDKLVDEKVQKRAGAGEKQRAALEKDANNASAVVPEEIVRAIVRAEVATATHTAGRENGELRAEVAGLKLEMAALCRGAGETTEPDKLAQHMRAELTDASSQISALQAHVARSSSERWAARAAGAGPRAPTGRPSPSRSPPWARTSRSSSRRQSTAADREARPTTGASTTRSAPTARSPRATPRRAPATPVAATAARRRAAAATVGT